MRYYDQDDEPEIRELLLNHRVERVDGETLRLDNGTVIKVQANEGCGGCDAGRYYLDELTAVDNIITRVDFENGPGKPEHDPDYYNKPYVYRIFVVAADERINLLTVSGDDGNGYYGTGYELLVTVPGGEA